MNLYGYEVSPEIREGVIRELPYLDEIKNDEIREKVIDAWAISLSENGFEYISQVPGLPALDYLCSQPDHYYIVTRLSLAIYDAYNAKLDTPLDLDRDILVAGALCHDLGNTYEYSIKRRQAWEDDIKKEGFPCLRHPFYGAHLAMVVGLPDGVAHICAAHAGEGKQIKRSLAGTIVSVVDALFWEVLRSANNIYP